MCSSAKKIRLEDVVWRIRLEEEKTTAAFPDVVLQHIFGYLNVKDLKSASLACKKYNEVIWSSPEIIKKIKLKIYGSQHFDRSFHSTRKYQNMEMVEEMTRTLDNSLGIWNSFDTSQATSFKFSGLSQGVAGLLLLLTRMPLLEDLSIKCDFSGTSHTKVDLPKLKKFRSTDTAIFEFITASNVNDINVNMSRGKFPINFLRRCPKITAMRTNTYCFPHLAEAINNHEIDLKLSSIRLNLYSLQYIDNLSAFLMNQEQTLTALELRFERSTELATSFYENVLGRLTNLTSLDLRCGEKFNENDLYYLADLEKLTIDEASINSIARYNRKLRYLCCSSISTMLDDGLTFRNLTHLVVTYFVEENDCGKLASVIKNCPRIETVELHSLKREYVLRDKTIRLQNIENKTTLLDAIDVMLQKPTLRFLKLRSSDVDYLEEIFDKVCSNYGNLEILELCRMFPDSTTIFTFPNDPIEFNAGEQKKKFRHRK